MIGSQTGIRQADTIRLLSSARLKPPSLAPLADSEEEMQLLISLEYVTHGRLHAQVEGMPDLDHRELVFGVPNYTFINAAFAYTRPGGNRFNSERRGAWYCGFEIETSLAEVGFHLTRALADADNAFDNTTDYAELFADFIGPFQDLRGLDPKPECLGDDPVTAYPAGQAFADGVRKTLQCRESYTPRFDTTAAPVSPLCDPPPFKTSGKVVSGDLNGVAPPPPA